MLHSKYIIATGLAAALFAGTAAFAGDSPDDIKMRIGTGNPVAGKAKAALCQGCHGEDGNSATPNFPKLAGQYAVYIQKQIHDFQAGSRSDPIMSGMASTVTVNQDLLDISAYFASQKQMKGDNLVTNEAGRRRFLDSNGCVNCHGPDGKGKAPNNPQAPVIGGQHKDYLIKQLTDFKNGARTNDTTEMMPTVAGFMSDAEIEEVADYISGL